MFRRFLSLHPVFLGGISPAITKVDGESGHHPDQESDPSPHGQLAHQIDVHEYGHAGEQRYERDFEGQHLKKRRG